MSEFIDKAKGAANEAIGKAKVAIGEQTNNNDLIVKGGAQQAKGHAQQIVGEAKSLLKDKS